MDELIDILTPDGKPTGKTALKSEAHKNGWFHATVHIWLFTSDEKILLQKRALTKKVFPGIWDISVAGHIGAGEEIIAGAKREIFEENVHRFRSEMERCFIMAKTPGFKS